MCGSVLLLLLSLLLEVICNSVFFVTPNVHQAFLKRSVEDRLDAIEANLNANKVKVNAVEAKLDVIEAKHHAFEVHVMAKLGQVLARLPPPVMTDSTFSQSNYDSKLNIFICFDK